MPLGLIIMVFSAIIWVFVAFITAKITTKHFDGLLLQRGLAKPISMAFAIPETWGRGVIYSAFILVNGPRLRSAYGKQCKGFRFKQYATKIEFFLAWLNVSILMVSVLSLIWGCGVGPQIFVHVPAP